MGSILNEGEIFTKIHKFKMFRKEGNLFIDVYEVVLGDSDHKFIAVPNLLIQEADKKYFGFGGSKAEALKDCLEKIKDVPISRIVPPDPSLEYAETSDVPSEPEQKNRISTAIRRLPSFFHKSKLIP